jgi:TonB family protein
MRLHPWFLRAAAAALLLLGQPALRATPDDSDLPIDLSRLMKIGTPPKPISQTPPTYPLGMARSWVVGSVTIQFVIDKEGAVQNPYVVKSNNPWFERPAIDAILKWKYKPAEVNGKPVKIRVIQQISFNLDGGAGSNVELWRVSKGKEHDKLPPEFRWDVAPIPTSTLFPVYPFEQLQAGVAGKASITYVVGPDGRVIGAKLREASSPEFGLAVLAMIDAWRFTPAQRKDGVRCYANLAGEYDFRPNGRGDVPVSDEADRILGDLKKHPDRIVSPKDLDQPLKPLSRRPPVYPTALEKAGREGEAQIEFFVDRNGDAQLPRIVSASAPEFGYAAALAVATWRFEAPRKAGKAAAVRARISIGFSQTPEPGPWEKK